VSELVTYRRFTSEDIDAAYALTVELKWPHRAEDWRFMSQMGSGFVAIDNGEVVGTALTWHDGVDRASLGMVIVSPQRQGKGIGGRLMTLLIDDLTAQNKALGETNTPVPSPGIVFLHATPAGRPLYEKLGFRAIGMLDQHQGAAFQPPLVLLPAGERLRPLGINDTPRLIELASKAAGMNRSRLLAALLENADGIGLDRDGELIGFSLFRRFGRGFAIGPVVAPERTSDPANRAKALITYWLARNEGMFVRIDTPGDSGLTDWLTALGLPRVDTVVKMALIAPVADGSALASAPATPSLLPRDPACVQFGIISQALM